MNVAVKTKQGGSKLAFMISGFLKSVVKDYKMNKYIYLMALPVLAYYIIFHYGPMYGVIIAFKKYNIRLGIFDSPWVGLKYFKEFIGGIYFWRLIMNTLIINIYELIFAFPAPIIYALLINELRNKVFKRTVQTITYLPHFISVVVVCGIIVDFVSTHGVINDILAFFGAERSNLLTKPEMFRTIFVGSGIWTHIGWGTIVYLAALSNINPELYESAIIDGAGRLKQALYVTLPGIAPTIVILLILRIGHMMDVGWQKIILLYNPLTYETADVISSFVYRKGMIEANYSYSAAIGLFNSIINLILLLTANKISKKLKSTSLW